MTRKAIINKIAKITPLEADERETIDTLLQIHEFEPMACAERISSYLEGITYRQIFDLL